MSKVLQFFYFAVFPKGKSELALKYKEKGVIRIGIFTTSFIFNFCVFFVLFLPLEADFCSSLSWDFA